ncbi:MAG: hypothetical protein CVV46_13560 [Spirochaetae bacterium HGW-Spirochaetae-2]|jgi:TRAP-type C4-dicarboxylate transport system permease small subunit|nr:MAG: hypothetical protein CVV46_13560 [Spirochaetae bacterium HGW-Spirochaetae-2]
MKKRKGDYLKRFNEYVLMGVFLAMIIVIGLQVVARTFFSNAFAWVEEVARYLFVILVLGGAALAYENGLWVNVDIFSNKLSKKGRIIMDLIINCISLFFFVMISYLSYILFTKSAGQLTPALMIEVRYVYLAVPVFFTQMVFFSLRKIYKDIKA